MRSAGAAAASREGFCYLTGGARPPSSSAGGRTIDVDVALEPEQDELLRELARIKSELQVNVELASPGDFIPFPLGVGEPQPRHRPRGSPSFAHFDPYSQTLAKLERGHQHDQEDAAELKERGLVEPARLLELFAEIEPELYRFPAVDPQRFRGGRDRASSDAAGRFAGRSAVMFDMSSGRRGMKVLRFVVLLAVAAVAIPGVAHAGEPTPAQAEALERLQKASSTPVAADFADGAAALRERDGAGRRRVRDRSRARLPRRVPRPLRPLVASRAAAGRARGRRGRRQDVFFGQSVRGVPVQDAQLAVHLRGDSVVATNGAYLPLLPAGTKPVISAEEATAVAQSAADRERRPVQPPEQTYFNASLTMDEAERAAWDLDAATHLAWRVSLPTRESLVDAQTGRELIGFDPVHHAATDLSIRTSANGVQAPFCGWPGAIEWFDENGVRPGVTPDTEGSNAFTFANATYDYYRSKFGRLSFDGRDAQIEMTLDVNSPRSARPARTRAMTATASTSTSRTTWPRKTWSLTSSRTASPTSRRTWP